MTGVIIQNSTPTNAQFTNSIEIQDCRESKFVTDYWWLSIFWLDCAAHMIKIFISLNAIIALWGFSVKYIRFMHFSFHANRNLCNKPLEFIRYRNAFFFDATIYNILSFIEYISVFRSLLNQVPWNQQTSVTQFFVGLRYDSDN